MRTLVLLCLISSVFASSIPPRQGRDGDDFSIAINVRLVLFNVSVTDQKGRHISGLKDSDFEILDEGQPRHMELFSAEDVPATIGLVIDNSGSMRSKRADVQRAALLFVQGSNPEDEMFLVDFNDRVHMSLPKSIPFTSDPARIRSALFQMVPDGRTALYDALALALDHVKTGRRERRALVVLSDGGDNASRKSFSDVIPLAQQSNATIYTLGIYDDTDRDRNPGVLRKLARAGGGRAYFPKSPAAMEQEWSEIAGEIRSQYTLGFVPNVSGGPGTFRSVKILADHGRYSVNTRDGYVVPPR